MLSNNIVWVTAAELAEIKASSNWVAVMIRLRGDAIKPLLIKGFRLKVAGGANAED